MGQVSLGVQTYIGARVAGAGRSFASASVLRRAPAGRRHPRPALPRTPAVGQRRAAAHGQAARAARAGRVLGLLPSQLAAHPPLRQGVARALRAPTACAWSTVHSPGFAPGEDEAAVRAAVARLQIEHPVCIDLGFELWRAYDNEGWPARYLWDGDGAPGRVPLRRGRLRRDRAGHPGAPRDRARAAGADASRGRARRADRGPDARPARRLQRPVRRRRGVGGARRQPASCTSTASASPSSGPARIGS